VLAVQAAAFCDIGLYFDSLASSGAKSLRVNFHSEEVPPTASIRERQRSRAGV